MKLFYYFIKVLIMMYVKLFYNPIVVGINNIPRDGKIILCGNHTNNMDSILIISSVNRYVRFLAKKELIDNKFGWFFKSMGIIPVDRKTHDSNAFNKSIELLNNNSCICIFPEGTINRTNDTILKFKTGAVRMSNQTDTYIVPFTIKGNYKFNSKIKIEFYNKIKCSDNVDYENKLLMDLISNHLEKE